MKYAQDLQRVFGDRRRHVFVVCDSSRQPISIQGWSDFELHVDRSPAPVDNGSVVGSVSGAFVTDGSDGMIFFVPPGDWPAGNYHHQVRGTDSNGEVTTIAEGVYAVTARIPA